VPSGSVAGPGPEGSPAPRCCERAQAPIGIVELVFLPDRGLLREEAPASWTVEASAGSAGELASWRGAGPAGVGWGWLTPWPGAITVAGLGPIGEGNAGRMPAGNTLRHSEAGSGDGPWRRVNRLAAR
jgi:hypothetical protein